MHRRAQLQHAVAISGSQCGRCFSRGALYELLLLLACGCIPVISANGDSSIVPRPPQAASARKARAPKLGERNREGFDV
jgi:hypothetical protein